MNKNTVTIFMITFFVSSVVCKQIQIFDEIKEYNLQVVGKSSSSKVLDFSSDYLVENLCTAYNAKIKIKETFNFTASVGIYNDSNRNIRFFMEIVFDSNTETQEFHIAFRDEENDLESCIQIKLNKNRNNSIWKRKFKLIIKDPKIIKKSTNQYFLYFGQVVVSSFKDCLKNIICEYTGEIKDKNVGILSNKPSTNLNEYKITDKKTCTDQIIRKTCVQFYNDKLTNKTYLLIYHQFPSEYSQVLHQIGISRNLSTPFISYDYEMLEGFVLKIIEIDFDMYYFYYTNYLEAPSSTNECKNEKDFCGCEDKCVECYNKNTENKIVVQINMEKKKILGSACHLDPFNTINLSSLKLINNLSQKFMMMENNQDENIDEFFDEIENLERGDSKIKSTPTQIPSILHHKYLIDALLIFSVVCLLLIGILIYACSKLRNYTHLLKNQNESRIDNENKTNAPEKENFI